ncbi:MAG: hypothetical protein GC145_14510 [Caulobacter sp.]|nr:hypothetical protein [Caulobacter sp.]
MPDQLQSLIELFTVPANRPALAILLVILAMAILGGRSIRYCPVCGSPNPCDCRDERPGQ